MAIVISIVSYPFLPAKTGGAKFIASFNNQLSRYHQLICVTTKKNDRAYASGYELLNFLSNSKIRYLNIMYFFMVRKIIRQKKASHLIIEHPYYGWLGVLLKIFTGVKLIVHSHNIEGLRWKAMGKWWWKILLRYEKFTHRKADINFFIQGEDKNYAIENFGLNPSKCFTITYGIERNAIPTHIERMDAKKLIMRIHNISPEKKILLFNGAFNYKPNIDALKKIIFEINPRLIAEKEFNYLIIICGMNVPDEILKTDYPNLIFTGYVEKIENYFNGADVFLNPVTEGGGIKTKLVEALGSNLNAVSTLHGAVGIEPKWCNNKLQVSMDNNFQSFSELVVKATKYDADINSIFFEHFYWGNIIKIAAEVID
jgi:polysaccharide biosynthesis protein PslH